jgi:hypothetical protein
MPLVFICFVLFRFSSYNVSAEISEDYVHGVVLPHRPICIEEYRVNNGGA